MRSNGFFITSSNATAKTYFFLVNLWLNRVLGGGGEHTQVIILVIFMYNHVLNISYMQSEVVNGLPCPPIDFHCKK